MIKKVVVLSELQQAILYNDLVTVTHLRCSSQSKT